MKSRSSISGELDVMLDDLWTLGIHLGYDYVYNEEEKRYYDYLRDENGKCTFTTTNVRHLLYAVQDIYEFVDTLRDDDDLDTLTRQPTCEELFSKIENLKQGVDSVVQHPNSIRIENRQEVQ